MRRVGAGIWAALTMGCADAGVGPPDMPGAAPLPRGDLEVVTTRSGPGVDPDGYELTLDGVGFGLLEAEDTLRLISVPAVDYWVGLAAVAGHCKVGGGNPRGIRVEASRTTRVIFVVKCDPPAATPTS